MEDGRIDKEVIGWKIYGRDKRIYGEEGRWVSEKIRKNERLLWRK